MDANYETSLNWIKRHLYFTEKRLQIPGGYAVLQHIVSVLSLKFAKALVDWRSEVSRLLDLEDFRFGSNDFKRFFNHNISNEAREAFKLVAEDLEFLALIHFHDKCEVFVDEKTMYKTTHDFDKSLESAIAAATLVVATNSHMGKF